MFIAQFVISWHSNRSESSNNWIPWMKGPFVFWNSGRKQPENENLFRLKSLKEIINIFIPLFWNKICSIDSIKMFQTQTDATWIMLRNSRGNSKFSPNLNVDIVKHFKLARLIKFISKFTLKAIDVKSLESSESVRGAGPKRWETRMENRAETWILGAWSLIDL